MELVMVAVAHLQQITSMFVHGGAILSWALSITSGLNADAEIPNVMFTLCFLYTVL